jgi:hypothetical protein
MHKYLLKQFLFIIPIYIKVGKKRVTISFIQICFYSNGNGICKLKPRQPVKLEVCNFILT